MSLTALFATFGVVFLAELPDKTAIASLVLGTRYRPSWVFSGVAAAFLVHVVLAVAAGALLTLIPERPLQAVVAALFLLGAFLMLRGLGGEEGVEEESEEVPDLGRNAGFAKVARTSFAVIMVAEFGDLTQIVTANLAAKYHDPLAVGIGATLGLWAVGGIAIVGGRGLLKLMPLHLIVRVAAAVMVVLAAISLAKAITG